MYLNYYGLRTEPFHITPDPYFFYLSPSHKEAFASMFYGIKYRKGFVAVTGEVGLGKTTALKSFLERYISRESVKTVFVYNPNISFSELIKIIHYELGEELPGKIKGNTGLSKSDKIFEMVQNLHSLLINYYKKGFNVVLIIDEAQNMPISTLENLRMLSNLETSQNKLIQILLIGQPELENKLKMDRLRQLRQRLAVRATLKPLSKKETYSYIKYRLQKAGAANNKTIFSKRAYRAIYKYSSGAPRTINILCNNALLTGFGYEKNKIGAGIIKEVNADLSGKKYHNYLKWILFALIPVLAVLGWFLFASNMMV